MKKFFAKIRSWYQSLSPSAKPGVVSIALLVVLVIIAAIIFAIL